MPFVTQVLVKVHVIVKKINAMIQKVNYTVVRVICGGTGNVANTCYCYIGYTGLNCETGSYSKINLKKNQKLNSI